MMEEPKEMTFRLRMANTKDCTRAVLIFARSGYVWDENEQRFRFKIGKLTKEEELALNENP